MSDTESLKVAVVVLVGVVFVCSVAINALVMLESKPHASMSDWTATGEPWWNRVDELLKPSAAKTIRWLLIVSLLAIAAIPVFSVARA